MSREEVAELPDKQMTQREKKSLISAVERALEEIVASGESIDFQKISQRTGIARSTLYRNRVVREQIIAARERDLLPSGVLSRLQCEVEELRIRVEDLERKIGTTTPNKHQKDDFI